MKNNKSMEDIFPLFLNTTQPPSKQAPDCGVHPVGLEHWAIPIAKI